MIIEKMALELGIPINFVTSLSRTASHEYKTYGIPKRSGGTRIIHHPSRRLKALQRWLLLRAFERLRFGPPRGVRSKRRTVYTLCRRSIFFYRAARCAGSDRKPCIKAGWRA